MGELSDVWRSTRADPRLATGVTLLLAGLLGCDQLVSPPRLLADLRDPAHLTAVCTGTPLPTPDQCRAQGEQALEELAPPGGTIARVDIVFGALAQDGYRTVTWTLTDASGTEAKAETEVCDGEEAGDRPRSVTRSDGS